jgi:GxxExxY protein
MAREESNNLGGIILDSAIAVHKELGPGLLESAYTKALLREFELRNIPALQGVVVNMKL